MTEPAKEQGIMDGQLDWGDKGGKCWEFWVCSPCCGGYCCITWWCCGCLNQCKLFSWALDQPCAVVNHCLPLCLLGSCMGPFVRNAMRTKLGISAGGPKEGFAGDCLCACCCGSCTGCQQLRGAHITGGQESWDFFGDMKVEVSAADFKSFPPFTPMK